jgi:hypothetical protein
MGSVKLSFAEGTPGDIIICTLIQDLYNGDEDFD